MLHASLGSRQPEVLQAVCMLEGLKPEKTDTTQMQKAFQERQGLLQAEVNKGVGAAVVATSSASVWLTRFVSSDRGRRPLTTGEVPEPILRMRYVSVRSLTMPKPFTDRLFTRLAIA